MNAMNKTALVSSLCLLLAASACSSSTAPNEDPAAPAPPGSGAKDTPKEPTGTQHEALSFTAPCTANACGAVPESSKSGKPTCAPAAGTCGWTDPNPDAPVSYRECDEADCGPAPDPSLCPAGTTFKGAACGSENEGACLWRSTCSPPPSTTPCADPEGCGPMPEIGVVCKDGSTGELRCMSVKKQGGAACGWERSCE